MRLRKTIQRTSLLLLSLVVLAVVVAKLWPANPTEIGKTLTFSDGSTMTLVAVTHGMENRYPGDTVVERFLSILPDKLTRKYFGNRNLMWSSTGRPEIVFWLKHTGPGPARDPQVILLDANGFDTGKCYRTMRLSATANAVEGFSFPYWPRREKTFTLRIYERAKFDNDNKPIGEFVIANPTPGKYPTWTASPLPITNRTGNLAITLFDLTAGLGHGSHMWQRATNATVSETRAGFRLEENGQPTKNWEIVGVETSDATGNLITDIRGTSLGYGSEELYADLVPHPSPAESAWKLRVGFGRKTNFEPADLWTVHIPLSESSNTNAMVMKTNLHGILVEYSEYHLPDHVQGGIEDGREFMFKMTPSGTEDRRITDYRLSLAKAVDNTGRLAELKSAFTGWNDRGFTLVTSSNATSVDLTVALNQTRYVEFVAPPRIASTNDVPPQKKKAKR